MFDKLRQLVKESVIYGVGTIAPRAVNFLLLPFYSHLMPPDEYGIYALFMLLATFLQPVYIHGMDIAYLRFTAKEGREQQREDLGSALLHTLFVGGAITALMFIFATPVGDLMVAGSGELGQTITRMVAVVMLMDTLSANIYHWERIKQRPITFSAVRMINVLVNIGLNIVLVGVFDMGVLGIFWALVGASASVLLTQLIIARNAISLSYPGEKIRSWLIFGLPNLPSQVFLVITEFSDRKWIEYYLSSEQVGLYSAGYRVAMLMSMIAQAFRYAWQPFFLREGDEEGSRELFARVLTYYVLFAGWVWLASAFFLPDLLMINWFGMGPLIDASYWAGLEIVPIVMLAHIFSGVYATFMVGVYLKNKTWIIPVAIGGAALINVVGNGLLIPIYGYMASAWLTVASYVTMTVILFAYIRRKYAVPYEWDRVIRTAMTVAAAWGVAQPFDGPGGIGIRAALLLFVPLVWWSYVLRDDERVGILRRLGMGKG